MSSVKVSAKTSRELSGIPLVAIGASAGGLEPLEVFFKNAPTDRG